MSDRIKHLRAGLLLTLSSILLIVPISYWFPLGEYLTSIDIEDYADFKQTLEVIIGIYFTFFILNLITAGLSATKVNHKVKFWLSLIPAVVLLVLPVLLVIPIAAKYPKQSFFEVFQGLYSLLRFNSTQLLWLVLALTVFSVAINVSAALIFKSATNPERLPKHLSNRYLVYAGVAFLVLAMTVLIGFSNASARDSDRKACIDYSALPLPEYDDQLETYISNVRLISSQSGSKELKTQFNNFSDLSIEYLSLVITEPDNAAKLAQSGEAISAIRENLDVICSQFSVK
ncbi:MAG: hypothetical protein RLZZ606_391 [Actinomycetota bacterium]